MAQRATIAVRSDLTIDEALRAGLSVVIDATQSPKVVENGYWRSALTNLYHQSYERAVVLKATPRTYASDRREVDAMSADEKRARLDALSAMIDEALGDLPPGSIGVQIRTGR